MEYEAQLKLQAYLDGELPEKEAREMESLLASDPSAAALLSELRQTHEALAGSVEEIRLPESREFYWSKIKREIERLESAVTAPAASMPLLARLRRLLVPVAGVALLVIAGLMVYTPSSPVSLMQTELADSGAVIYHDYSAKATFVWLSYPADDEAGEDEMSALE
jgi:anti-sigma factor RsiW